MRKNILRVTRAIFRAVTAIIVAVAAGIDVAQATPLDVTATSTSYTTVSNPFQALAVGNGVVFVSISTATVQNPYILGIQAYSSNNGSLNNIGFNGVSPLDVNSVSNLSALPNGLDIAAGMGSGGATFWSISALLSCTTTCGAPWGIVVPNVTAQINKVVVTPDGQYAFISSEFDLIAGGNVGVVKLSYDSSGHVASATLLGGIATGGKTIAGMTLSPNGKRLYITSQSADAAKLASYSVTPSGGGNPILSAMNCGTATPRTGTGVNGLLTVVDVPKATSLAGAATIVPGTPAVLAVVNAGCQPVRMAETSDGYVLWVAARADNRVLAFSTCKLDFDPNNALISYADTGGKAPVGLSLFNGDRLLAVANSNRFSTPVQNGNLAILDVTNPSAAIVVKAVPALSFPREVTVGSDDTTLYLTNYASKTLQVISTSVAQ